MTDIRISLEACRVNAKLTLQELADTLNVSRNTVWNWENGLSEPSLSQIREISNISGIPIDFIFLTTKSN